jgi:hypothetical protein
MAPCLSLKSLSSLAFAPRLPAFARGGAARRVRVCAHRQGSAPGSNGSMWTIVSCSFGSFCSSMWWKWWSNVVEVQDVAIQRFQPLIPPSRRRAAAKMSCVCGEDKRGALRKARFGIAPRRGCAKSAAILEKRVRDPGRVSSWTSISPTNSATTSTRSRPS